MPKEFSREFFVRQGRIGGKIGGKRTKGISTPAKRAAARKGLAIRWARYRARKKLGKP